MPEQRTDRFVLTSSKGLTIDNRRASGPDLLQPYQRYGKPNALQQSLTPSTDLAAVIGAGAVTRGDMISKVWVYIKKNNLQNPANKREIIADAKLKPIFGADKVTMFEMNKHLSKHLNEVGGVVQAGMVTKKRA